MYILNNDLEIIKFTKKEFKKYNKIIKKIKKKYKEVNNHNAEMILCDVLNHYRHELYNVDCIILNKDLSFEILYKDNNYNIMFQDVINLIIEETFVNEIDIDYIKVDNSLTIFDNLIISLGKITSKKIVVNNLKDYICYFKGGEISICYKLYDVVSDKVYDLYLFCIFVLFILKNIILYSGSKIKYYVNLSLNLVKI